MIQFLATIYVLVVSGLSLFGLLGLYTLFLYWRHRDVTYPLPVLGEDDWPMVTVQLPIFNERFVVERLLEAAVRLEYPSGRLQIQVLDDSTDETVGLTAVTVQQYQARGINIQHLHRTNRDGYKAGALQAAMPFVEGEFIALFDADFQPDPDFLLQTIPHFLDDAKLGMVQTRWGHLNDHASALTAAQAIALDKHFMMEQTVRHRAALFPKFNGSGGLWRRECLENAGGWQTDTVCEDLCLSIRAVLGDWQFLFLEDVVAPAELPATVLAYKSQQARWAKGSIQCLKKYAGQIWRDKSHSVAARLYALLSMSAYLTHPLLLLLLLLQIPLVYFEHHFSPAMFAFSLAGIGQPLLFIFAQLLLYNDWKRRLLNFPVMVLLAVGTAPSNSRAIAQTFFKREHTFDRTPKGGQALLHEAQFTKGLSNSYRLAVDKSLLVEIAFFCVAVLGIAIAILKNNYAPLFLLTLCMFGFGYVVWLSWQESKK